MANPIILSVDDEPQVLNAIERDLRRQYRREYRIINAGSGAEALDVVKRLKQRNDPLALFLVDQRMPNMSGTEFLEEARKLYPEARKVLLTAYADTEAAIASINSIGLDHYLMKPWDPPDMNLYPVLDDLLSDWLANVPVPYDGIRVAGTLWSSTSHDVKNFLARNRIPYQWLDIESNDEARELVESVDGGASRLPVVFFPEGDNLVNPDNRSLADKVGLRTQATQEFYDLIIVGAGPAGLAGAVYSASEGLRVAMIEKQATGGQAGGSAMIENYLGFPRGLSGGDLARRATAQAERFGTEILTAQEVTKVRVEDPYRIAVLGDGTELSCHAMLIASGVSVSKLDVPGADEVTGAGVYYGAAITEAANYRDEHVLVVGGGNSAGMGVTLLSRYAKKVSMLVRGPSLAASMSQYLIDQIDATENIEVLPHTEVTEVSGARKLEAVTVKNNETGETRTIDTPAIFIFIGAVPHTDMVAGLVDLDPAGFILTGENMRGNGGRPKNWRLQRDPYLMETSVPGILAAGDVRSAVTRRVASAVGQGAVAISFVHQYLKTV